MVNTGQAEGHIFPSQVHCHTHQFPRGAASEHMNRSSPGLPWTQPHIFLRHRQVSTRLTLTLWKSRVTLGPHYNLAVWGILAVSYIITSAAFKKVEVFFPHVTEAHFRPWRQFMQHYLWKHKFTIILKFYIQGDKAKTFPFLCFHKQWVIAKSNTRR